MHIVICDDSNRDRQDLILAIEELERELSLELSVSEFSNSKDLFSALESELNIDEIQVVFMDVYMGNEMGTDAVKKLKDMGYLGSVIFCTNSEDHALESYKLKADGYLVKPFSYSEFKDATWRLNDLFTSQRQYLSFVSERIEYQIEFEKVLFIETENKGCMVHTLREKIFTWQKISEFAKEVENIDFFYIIGRSYIININQIKQIKDDDIIMKDNSSILLPSRSKKTIKQDINNYFLNMTRSLS